jgi:hypothetical protein
MRSPSSQRKWESKREMSDVNLRLRLGLQYVANSASGAKFSRGQIGIEVGDR